MHPKGPEVLRETTRLIWPPDEDLDALVDKRYVGDKPSDETRLSWQTEVLFIAGQLLTDKMSTWEAGHRLARLARAREGE